MRHVLRPGLAVKRICDSCSGLRFSSQHPHGGSQSSLTLVPRDPMPSWAPGTYAHGAQMYSGKILIHISKKKNLKTEDKSFCSLLSL